MLIFSRDLKIGDSGKVELILRFRILIPEQGDIYYTKWMNIWGREILGPV